MEWELHFFAEIQIRVVVRVHIPDSEIFRFYLYPVFEGTDGRIIQPSEEDLPYDVKTDRIQIEPEDFGIWYVDATCPQRPGSSL